MYTDNNNKIITIINTLECQVVDTLTDTTSCGTADNAVSEIENSHHL